MASALSLMKSGITHMDVGHGVIGPIGFVADTALGFGTSYVLGQVYHRHSGEKWGGQVPRIVAALGKGLAALTQLLTGGGQSLVSGALDSVGQAGVNAMGLEMGLRHAREATGKESVILPKGTDLKKLPDASRVTSIGAIAPAPRGRGLNWDQIEELASMH